MSTVKTKELILTLFPLWKQRVFDLNSFLARPDLNQITAYNFMKRFFNENLQILRECLQNIIL